MKTKIILVVLLMSAGLWAGQEKAAPKQEPAKQPHRVLGDLPFSYSYNDTLALARRNGRPIFAYFTFET